MTVILTISSYFTHSKITIRSSILIILEIQNLYLRNIKCFTKSFFVSIITVRKTGSDLTSNVLT